MGRYNSVACLLSTFSLLGICPLISYTQTQSIVDPVVTILQGSLRGTIWITNHGRNISAFRGIPYGQPPIGNLRFANPIAADGWDGIRNASEGANACAQSSSVEEDCLFLDVYTPVIPWNTNASLLPVMIFIHGGAFMYGSIHTDRFNPHYLLDEDVLLILPQYRLGPFGFLSTGDEVASGNWGLKDQILALKWVQNNIEYFGGDPDRVTIFGESAGGACVHLLTLSEATDGLFQKYITQSGSALGPWAFLPRASYANRSFELGKYVGCFNESSEALINCLRTVDASKIIKTHSQFIPWPTHQTIAWGPTDEPDIEGAVLTDSPANLFAAGKIRDLPWISGVVRDEGLIFATAFYENEELFDYFLKNFDAILPDMLTFNYQSDSGAAWADAIKSYYLNNDLTGNKSELLAQVTSLIGDALFYYPAYSALKQQFALAKNPQYFYTFNYKASYNGAGSTSYYGMRHGEELTYLFSQESKLADVGLTMNEIDFQVVDTMVQLWTSFATNGTPKSYGLINTEMWNPYSSKDNYLRIGNESDAETEMQYSFFVDRMQFWANLVTSSQNSGAVSYSTPILLVALLCLQSTLAVAKLSAFIST